jgi:hypothetical protein
MPNLCKYSPFICLYCFHVPCPDTRTVPVRRPLQALLREHPGTGRNLAGLMDRNQMPPLRRNGSVPAKRDLPGSTFVEAASQAGSHCCRACTEVSRYTKANHSVYMRFERRQHWHVSFVEALELARRGEAWGNLESRQSLERAIADGQGGCSLRVTPAQYARLRRP